MEIKEILTPVQRFWLLLKPFKKEIRQIYFIAVINGLVALSLPLGIQSIINLIQGGQISTAWIVLVLLVLCGIAIGGYMQVLQLRITENIQQSIFTKSAFEFTFRMPKVKLKELYASYAPELMNRFFGIPIVQKGLSKILIDFTTAIFQILLGLVLLSFYHPFFITISVVLLAILILIFVFTGRKGLTTSLLESKYKFEVGHWLEEVARSNKTFKLSGDTQLHLNKTDNYVSNYLEARENHFLILRSQYFWMIAFKVIVAGMLLSIGGLLVINQQMNIGQFVAAELVILLIIGSVEKLILSLETIYDVLASLEKVGQVTDLELEQDRGIATENIDRENGLKVELKEVSFSYLNKSKKNIEYLNLTIKAGEKVMIAGENGAGKTTLLNLLAGFYEAEQGSVCFNGLPIANYSMANLRSVIGCCFSGTTLFHGTLSENISLGKPGITTSDVLSAASLAGLEDFIKFLPEGINTVVVPEGKTFSESTIQKIIIARALACKPRLLLIDECINAINKNERDRIISNIIKSEKNTTMVIISSSSFIAELCDAVIVLENGKLKAAGTFEKLKSEIEKFTE